MKPSGTVTAPLNPGSALTLSIRESLSPRSVHCHFLSCQNQIHLNLRAVVRAVNTDDVLHVSISIYKPSALRLKRAGGG
jgi:hypothetical protein